ncbi:hypothetical protein A3H38_04765 [candidate division WOR-1 bacterium RIFCSPLOWO2_02_FULL_46_20]|uniref:Heat-inducible transcription repressor HrcA n=2 Tax=Saganbacteria TaxID=1703751 RepID=A0A1F4RB65_UNCSA|nr:MAG: hypothetical protein A3J44_00320 [candidate division WOR-1 bacterium RIFCSPHIGHO2_02_FULL_45_12]OGC05424.1 MAG: hypothetical protein A3H38_04765 [candidate division WOR-1 bacterium RIFCSPLOWO2_02_FULL_46_20]OGC08993.1 MAG: hypothetical protein A3F86_06270 [candidate division WOR-1 bacterium RIFCSPLOWO2_12_FULL_45_9]
MTTQDLNERKQKILNAIVKDYQSSAEPVGSRHLSKNYLPDLSPATIRNEMADLEEEGYITQPHTSAGRIPTDRGYRFYVDHLMKAIRPSQREAELVKNTYNSPGDSPDYVLHQTAKLLSHALDYTAIVVNHGARHRVFSSGATALLHQPEFRNLTQMEKILSLLEEEEMLAELIEEYSQDEDTITVHIGSENKCKEVKECSIVTASYEIDNEPVGGISIIGPTRMYYSKATSLVAYVAKELSIILSGKY